MSKETTVKASLIFFFMASLFALLAFVSGHGAAVLVAHKLSPWPMLGVGLIMSLLAGISTFVGIKVFRFRPEEPSAPASIAPERKNCLQ